MVEQAKRPHHGQNVKRIREILGIKQEVLAHALDISQQSISQIEKKEILEKETLEKLAKAMNVSQESIENFSEEAAINIIATTFNSHDNSTSIAYNSTLNFNPVEKIIELYERLLAVEKEKNELLQQLQSKQQVLPDNSR